MLEATIKVPLMKNILKGLQSVSEDCILDFNTNGLTVHVVDSIRAKMLRLRVSPEGFENTSVMNDTVWQFNFQKSKTLPNHLLPVTNLNLNFQKDNLVWWQMI